MLTPSNDGGTLIGAIVGGIAALLLLIVIIACMTIALRRRRRKSDAPTNTTLQSDVAMVQSRASNVYPTLRTNIYGAAPTQPQSIIYDTVPPSASVHYDSPSDKFDA
jgi:hypothetical protein